MAYQPHTLIAFGGSLADVGAADEIWECTVRVISPGGSGLPLSDAAGYMGQVAGPLQTWFTTPAVGMSSKSTLAWLKVNNIAADGTYSAAGGTNVHDYSPPQNGGSTAAQAAPAFCSLALSWTTNRRRPPGAFGRIYPPNFNYPMGGSAVSSASQTAAVGAAVALLDVLRNCDGSLGAIPVIASRVNATNTEITGCRVGNIYDVQRRRKNAVPETYQAEAWDSSCG